MLHPHTELRLVSEEIGYGVFATRPIAKGTVLWVLCKFDMVFRPEQVRQLPPPYKPIIDKYAYDDADGNCILCWDNGRMLNHSCDPSMLGVGTEIEIAVKDIAKGDEITCEYGELNLTEDMRCLCGGAHCRHAIKGDDPKLMWREWDRRVAEILPLAAKVEQPLMDYARDPASFWDWVHGRAPLPSTRIYRRETLTS